MSYRVLVLRDNTAISLPVLRKVKELIDAGAAVVGPKPLTAMSLRDSDDEVCKIADELWNSGRAIADRTARQVLLSEGVAPDCEFTGGDDEADLDFIHRSDGQTDIYFVTSRGKSPQHVTCTFRVQGKAPELWDAVSGRRSFARDYREADGRTSLPLDFAPCGSWFVVFRQPANLHPTTGDTNSVACKTIAQLDGPWQVDFDPQWGGPGKVEFSDLIDWTKRPEAGVKFYSGTAVYRKAFQWPEGSPAPAPNENVWLDLGTVHELASVKVNGQSCGIVWAPPFRVDISQAVKPGTNDLEIDVVNFWPNRIIGDAALPPEQRLTHTNIRKLTKDTPLMSSGLWGPVRLMTACRTNSAEGAASGSDGGER